MRMACSKLALSLCPSNANARPRCPWAAAMAIGAMKATAVPPVEAAALIA